MQLLYCISHSLYFSCVLHVSIQVQLLKGAATSVDRGTG